MVILSVGTVDLTAYIGVDGERCHSNVHTTFKSRPDEAAYVADKAAARELLNRAIEALDEAPTAQQLAAAEA